MNRLTNPQFLYSTTAQHHLKMTENRDAALEKTHRADQRVAQLEAQVAQLQKENTTLLEDSRVTVHTERELKVLQGKNNVLMKDIRALEVGLRIGW